MKIDTKKAKEFIAQQIPEDILKLSKLFKEHNFDLYLVGGCIRDLLLDKEPKDWDVCTNAVPQAITLMLEKAGINYNVQGAHFGIVVAKLEQDIEVATFREDDHTQLQSDNIRHNAVKIGVTIEEDSKRRDFTINALYYDIENKKLLDFHRGVEDLNLGLIRCVGIPEERFKEDPLRMIRLVRFSALLGFDIEDYTFQAVYENPTLINQISKERLFAPLKPDNKDAKEGEFVKAFAKAKDKSHFWDLLIQTKLIWELFKEGSFDTIPERFQKDLQMSLAHIFQTKVMFDKKFDLKKHLIELGFETRFAKGIDFLAKFAATEVGKIDPMKFFKLRDGCDLTDDQIIEYCNNTVEAKAFVLWKPVPGLAEKLQAEGFKDKELGQKLNEVYTKKYSDMVQALSL